ncbi:MAG TPA: hypothetical protein VFR96_09555, partial [Povalibacter sp.]|nr:hypothetical protein [Povalibacter sp.]
MNNFARIGFTVATVVLCLAGCHRNESTGTQSAAHASMDRTAFNKRAVELFLPLFWSEDANQNRALDPDELAVLNGYPRDQRSVWIDSSGQFTAEFRSAYERMQQPTPMPDDPAEQTRRKLVLEELAQGRPTLVATDEHDAPAAEKNFVSHMLKVGELTERLYARQKGVFDMEARIPDDDPASHALFHRNQSPFCQAPRTEGNPACTAVVPKPARAVGLYPAELQNSADFCSVLEKQPNASELMDHFSIVVAGDKAGTYRAVPYSQAYSDDMQAVAAELEAAAGALGEDEAALKHYLLTAAESFRTNDWEPANVAWVAMNAQNSKWFVRIAPDEVYYDPCAWKAGFALELAHINPQSVEWQRKLDPLKG